MEIHRTKKFLSQYTLRRTMKNLITTHFIISVLRLKVVCVYLIKIILKCRKVNRVVTIPFCINSLDLR